MEFWELKSTSHKRAKIAYPWLNLEQCFSTSAISTYVDLSELVGELWELKPTQLLRLTIAILETRKASQPEKFEAVLLQPIGQRFTLLILLAVEEEKPITDAGRKNERLVTSQDSFIVVSDPSPQEHIPFSGFVHLLYNILKKNIVVGTKAGNLLPPVMAPAGDIGQIEICEELDRIILHLFDALEMLQTKREAFNSMVEQGWFSLSKSRYAMGNKSVSTLQYGHQMTPLIRIETSKAEDGQIQFQVIAEDSFKGKVESPAFVEEIGPSEQVLRRRKGPGKTEDAAQSQNTASQPAETLGHQDPLNWFGILVPQSLRQAQKTFRDGIHLAAEIASIQGEIEATRSYYQSLLEKKQKLVAGKEQYSP